MKRNYDSTVARMAGNILSGEWPKTVENAEQAVEWAVELARAIVAEVQRTESVERPDPAPQE